MFIAKINVLLVDDEQDFIEPLANRLTLRKLSVRKATNGAAALKVLEQEPVDVIVLDMKMPDMDGLQVLREAKTLYPQIEVILLTGHTSVESSIEGLELGAFDYLLKPVAIDELVYKIQDAFQKKRLQDLSSSTQERK